MTRCKDSAEVRTMLALTSESERLLTVSPEQQALTDRLNRKHREYFERNEPPSKIINAKGKTC